MKYLQTLVLLLALTIAGTCHAQSEWIDVKKSGAVGNGTTDDTAAINAAISLLPSRGGILYFPPGRYRVSSKIVLPDKRVSVLGDGIGISTIEWTNIDGGMLYQPTIAGSSTGSDNGRELAIAKLTFRTTQPGGGTALKAVWPESSGQVVSTLRLNEVEVRGSDFSKFWNGGIDLQGGRFSSLADVEMYGNSGNNSSMSFGLKITSNNSSTEYFIENFKILFAQTAVWVTGGTAGAGNGPEGIYIEKSAFISVGTGVLDNATSSEPLLFVRGSHISATNVGINSNALQAVYSDNVIYHTNSGGVGISVNGLTIDVAISNNNFLSTRTPETSTGVVVSAQARRVAVTGNHFNTITSGVWLQSGSQENFVANNVFANCANKVVNQGTNNTIYGWGASTP